LEKKHQQEILTFFSEKCLRAVMSFLCYKPPFQNSRVGKKRRAESAAKLLPVLDNQFQLQVGESERFPLLEMRWRNGS